MTPQEFLLQTEEEIALSLAIQAKKLRIIKNITQVEFAKKSGIAYATYSKFERTGKISLNGFLKVLRHLGRLKEISTLLSVDSIEELGIKEFAKLSSVKEKKRAFGKAIMYFK